MSENTTVTLPENRPGLALARSVQWAADAVLARMIEARLFDTQSGRLHLTLPSGRALAIARPGGHEARIALGSYRGLIQAVRRGYIGLADSYLDGDIETDDLESVFEYFLDNEAVFTGGFRFLDRMARADLGFHASRRNTREGSRRNIAAHYDLGNAFYRLWLDESLSYSSGIYRAAGDTLEQAQAAKYDSILDALDVQPGHEILEIGCGWGAFAIAAVRRGARVTGITISAEQHAEATARVAALGLSDSIRIVFQDYRDTTGTFDRIASIEMIEAVGEENWPAYFGVIRERLKPGGCAVIQGITIRDDLYPAYKARPDFIQRYIFPGGMLPTEKAMQAEASDAGLGFATVETFGQSYVLTLADWRRRFEAAWPRIAALGFDERFRRMWLYYLVYCEVGFRRGSIDVGLYRVEKSWAARLSSVHDGAA